MKTFILIILIGFLLGCTPEEKFLYGQIGPMAGKTHAECEEAYSELAAAYQAKGMEDYHCFWYGYYNGQIDYVQSGEIDEIAEAMLKREHTEGWIKFIESKMRDEGVN